MANYHAQAKKTLLGLESVDYIEVSVDFYADYVASWGWAPCLMLEWPTDGFRAWIQKEAGSYARWGVTGYTSPETSGKMHQGRVYAMKIVIERNNNPSQPVTSITLQIRDRTFGGNWDILYGVSRYGYLTDDPVVYLGTIPTYDYSSSGAWETYRYENFVCSGMNTIDWDYNVNEAGKHHKWVVDRSPSSSVTKVDQFANRQSVLKFSKYANYHAQVQETIDQAGNSCYLEVSVDFYADYVTSWSWAPCLMLEWPTDGFRAWIQKEAGSYARWGVTGYTSPETYGMMHQDRWYTMSIVTQRLPGGDTGITLRIRDVTSYGDWNILYTGLRVGYSVNDPVAYLGTTPTYDFIVPGSWETYYYDNFLIRQWTRESGQQGKYAIAIGTNNNLAYPDEDVTDWYHFLSPKGYQVQVYGDQREEDYPRYDGTSFEYNVRSAIQGLADYAQPGDKVVIVTSGHGRADETPGWPGPVIPDSGPNLGNEVTSYLVMQDGNSTGGDWGGPYDGYYYESEFISDLNKFPAGVEITIVVDHCASGGFIPDIQNSNNAADILYLCTATGSGYGYDGYGEALDRNGKFTYWLLQAFSSGQTTWEGAFNWLMVDGRYNPIFDPIHPADTPQKYDGSTWDYTP